MEKLGGVVSSGELREPDTSFPGCEKKNYAGRKINLRKHGIFHVAVLQTLVPGLVLVGICMVGLQLVDSWFWNGLVDVPCCMPEFWAYLLISFILVLFAGITSGLALGLLSFNHVDLEVLIKSGQPQERKNAAKILPVVKNQHLLLCTLLIVKSLAMEALPIFLDSILPSWAAILLSVTLVLVFAEIVPQAVCARHGLTLGAKLSAFVRFLLMVFYPIARPMGKLLDWMLGKDHSALLRRAELKTLVDLHAIEAGKGGDLSHHETTIISGALDLTLKTAKDAMTPLSETFSLDINSKLDLHTMGLIMSKGHSRVPIYSGKLNNIIGIILVKNLIFCRPEDETPIKYLTIRSVPRVHEDWPLYDILNQFQKGHSHMAIVVKSKKKANGTVGDVGRPTMLHILEQKQVDRKGLSPPFDETEGRSISTNTSPLYSTDTEFQSPTSKPVIEQDTSLNPQTEKSERGNVRFSPEGVDLLPCKSDEEVIGIITMEDVMEELLQGEILDETDEYVNFYNKLRINLLPSRRSSLKSPSRFSVTSHFWRTPEASPLSTYSPILRSPISPYILPPLIKPTLSASPERAMMKSHPTGFASLLRSSPSSYQSLKEIV